MDKLPPVMEPRSRAVQVGAAVVNALPQRIGKPVRSLLGKRTIREIPVAKINSELAGIEVLMAESPELAQAQLASLRVVLESRPPKDPFSDVYKQWVCDQYSLLSGRCTYDTSNEASRINLAAAKVRPFPYQTNSLALVARDLEGRAKALQHLSALMPQPLSGQRVVEFGSGWGGLTYDLVSTGLNVTAVEVDEQFCELLRHRCTGPGLLDVVNTDMLGFTGSGFDAALFFESFHHCADHLAMLRHLKSIVRPKGAVLFASEPIHPMGYAWGPRLDGLSVWSTRTYGWLELGFDLRYFQEALARTGWCVAPNPSATNPRETDVIVARQL